MGCSSWIYTTSTSKSVPRPRSSRPHYRLPLTWMRRLPSLSWLCPNLAKRIQRVESGSTWNCPLSECMRIWTGLSPPCLCLHYPTDMQTGYVLGKVVTSFSANDRLYCYMQVQCVRKSQTVAYDMQVSKSDPTTLLKKLTSNECVNLVLASAQAEIQCRKRLHMGGAIWSAGSHMVEYPLA